MVEIRYIQKGGKRFGPYYYRTYRENGKIKKSYIGSEEDYNAWKKVNSRSTTNWKPFLVLAVGLIVILGALFYFNHGRISGHAILDISSVSMVGENLSGDLKLVLKFGELLPADTKIVVEQPSGNKEFLLSDFFNLTSGEYYAEGFNISGQGKGIGFEGKKVVYPDVHFTFLISENPVNESAGGSANEGIIPPANQTTGSQENINETVGIVNETNNTTNETNNNTNESVSSPVGETNNTQTTNESSGTGSTETPPETPSTPTTETPNESAPTPTETPAQTETPPETPSTPTTETPTSGEGSAGSSITGAVISSGEQEIAGVVSADHPFSYDTGGYYYFIEPDSVRSEFENLSSNVLKSDMENNTLIITTDYSYDQKGFGKDYVGNENKLSIPLNKFNLKAEKGTLKISLVYGKYTLSQTSKDMALENLTEKMINETGNESLKRYKVVINRPVKWQKKISVVNQSEISVELPKAAGDISVKTGAEIQQAEQQAQKEESAIQNDKTSVITGNAVISGGGSGILSKVWKRIVGSITGHVIADVNNVVETNDSKVINVNLDKSTPEVLVEYTTPGPIANESDKTDTSKKIIISAPSELNYTDVLAYTELDNKIPMNKSKEIKLYWYASYEDAVKYGYIKENNTNLTNTQNNETITNGTRLDNETFIKPVNETAANQTVTDVTVNESETNNSSINENNVVNETNSSSEANNALNNSGIILDGSNITDDAGITGGVIETSELADNSTASNSTAADSANMTNTNMNRTVRIEVYYNAYDLDGDGMVDYIEWTVPHLSNQVYEVIYATKAEHLDENRNFIGNVYESVKARDNNWTNIPDRHYLRVTFGQNLTNKNDITIYARANDSSGSSIDVFREEDDKSIARFEGVSNESYYKIYLTNLSNNESQGTFDLKSIGGVDYDYVVDPTISSCGTLSDSNAYYSLSGDLHCNPPLTCTWGPGSTGSCSGTIDDSGGYCSQWNGDSTNCYNAGCYWDGYTNCGPQDCNLGYSQITSNPNDPTSCGLMPGCGWVADYSCTVSYDPYSADNGYCATLGDGPCQAVTCVATGGLVFTGNNVTFNGNGYSVIDSTPTCTGTIENGITVAPNANDIIKNVSIDDFPDSLTNINGGMYDGINNGATFSSSGVSCTSGSTDSSASFDGSGYMSLPLLSGSVNDVTMNIWAKTSYSGAYQAAFYNGNGASGNGGYGIGVNVGTGHYTFWEGYVAFQDSGFTPSGNWDMLTLFNNATGWYFCKNAVCQFVTSATAQTPIVSSSIGNVAGAWGWVGQLDEASFWNRALSQSEISTLYNSGTAVCTASGGGLIAGYHLDGDSASYAGSGNLTFVDVLLGDKNVGTSKYGISGTPVVASNGNYNNFTRVSIRNDTVNKSLNLNSYSSNYFLDSILPNNYLTKTLGLAAVGGARFGSVSYVTLSDMPKLNSASHFSFSTWFKEGNPNGGAFFSKGINAANDILIGYSTPWLFVQIDNGADGTAEVAWTADAKWHHLVVVYDGTATGNANRLKMYLDNVLQTLGFDGGAYTVPATTANLAGASEYLNNYFFSGWSWGNSMSETRIYNISLSASDVGSLYNSGSPVCGSPASGLLAGYHLNSNLTDYSGNGYNGAGTGSITFSNFSSCGSSTSYPRTLTFENSSYGQAVFGYNGSFSATGSNLLGTRSSVISMRLDNITINDIGQTSNLSLSENLTFYGLSGGGTPVPRKNSALCTNCGAVVNLGSGSYTFGASGFGSYDILLSTLTINFTFPTPGSGSLQGNSIYVNVSTNGTNDHYAFTNFDNSLLAWWRMDNSSSVGENDTKVYDWSGKGNNGTVNGATFNASGKFGGAYSFDGSSNYLTGSGAALPNLGDKANVTISAWIYLNSVSGTETVFNQGASGVSFSYGATINGGVLRARISAGDYAVSNSIGTGGWQHIAIVFNSTGVAGYINGTYTGSWAATTTTNVYSDWVIGRRAYNAASEYLNGSVDEVQVWNRSLSMSEVQALYNASKYQYYNNFAQLSAGVHTFKAYAVDTYGTMNSTEQRNVTLNLDSCTPPTSGNWNLLASDNCTFNSPVSIPGNVSITGTGVVNIFNKWNFAGTGQYVKIGSGAQLNINKSGGFNN